MQTVGAKIGSLSVIRYTFSAHKEREMIQHEDAAYTPK